jgi:hypothetical protein
MVNLNVRIDDFQHESLLEACKGRGCDKSTLVRKALKSYLEDPLPNRTVSAENPTPKGRLVYFDVEKPVAKGTVRWGGPGKDEIIQKARRVHHLGRDGKPLWTDHYGEDGKFQHREKYS